MRERPGLAPVAVLAVLAMAGPLAGADLPVIRARGTLRMIFGSDGPQETISLTGPLPGLEREMIEGFATLHRLKVELVATSSGADRIPALLADNGDVAGGGLIMTEDRRKLVDFTSEIFPTRHVAVTRRPHSVIETLEQLRGTRPELELGLFVGPVTSRAWGVRKDAPQLLEALNEYVTNFRRSGAWNRLVVKYYGDLALDVLRKARQEP